MSANEKDIQDYITKTLGVTIGLRGEFKWNNIPLRYYWNQYGGSVEIWVEEVSGFNIKKKHLNAEELCKYLLKNQVPLAKRYREKLIRDRNNEKGEQELIEHLNNAKTDRKIRWDGQNVQIHTGKDPILVKMIVDAIERYEADKETIELIYK